MSTSQQTSPRIFSTWMGMPVFLNVITGEKQTSLFCTIIDESDTTVRVRIADEWDVDIYKEMILVVDAYPFADSILSPENPRASM